jgi:hypothetical protein
VLYGPLKSGDVLFATCLRVLYWNGAAWSTVGMPADATAPANADASKT